MKKIFYSLLALLVLSQNIFAQKSEIQKKNHWLVPDYAKVQFAGNIGFLSAGIGYQFFNEKLNTELIYGYVPQEYAHIQIHTITTKNTFQVIRKSFHGLEWSPYLGFTFSYETGNNSFVELPDQYPEGYYSSNAFHLCILGGLSVKKELDPKYFIKGIGFYAEGVAVDSFLWYMVSSREIHFTQVVSLALGMNFYF